MIARLLRTGPMLLLLFCGSHGAVGQMDAIRADVAPLQEADLVSLEAELREPTTRLAAISKLAEFASYKLYRIGSITAFGGDPVQDKLRERAAELATKHSDFETVSLALSSNDVHLQHWGLWFCSAAILRAVNPKVKYGDALSPREKTLRREHWKVLQPTLQKLAMGSLCRGKAIDVLDSIDDPDQTSFLRSLIPKETSAGIILQILERTTIRRTGEGNAPRDKQYNVEVLRLLASAEGQVRSSTLGQIAWNWNSAEMWQVHFSAEVEARVKQLESSSEPEERHLAVLASEGLEKLRRLRDDRSTPAVGSR